MGNTWVALKGMLEYMGLDVVVPPPSSKHTLNLGVQHAPEFACLPLKINLGNFIEAKQLGADTILMAGGVGPCRFGLYGQLEKEILVDMGYEYESLMIEPPDVNVWQFIKRVKRIVGPVSWWRVIQGIRFGYHKACLVDELEKLVQEIRPREYVQGTADKIFAHSLLTIDRAKNIPDLYDAFGLAKQKLLHIPQDTTKPVLKIGLVGEIYTLLEPFASLDIEKKLGYLGAHVTRSLYLSEWIESHLLIGIFRRKAKISFCDFANPFLNHFVGGHGQETIGAAASFALQGYDGIVQVAPLTCMPEIVAHTIFPRVSEYYGIPILTIYVDEQSGEAGIGTRLEAFVDLLQRKVESKTQCG
jgi:predicted nucleotide-binding protein (sugar kinase/HSP70/actin superfamily)